MSFFANLLGGALQGVGSGMSAMAADEEKLQAQRALLQDKQQAALELQRERAADRQWQQEQMLQMRAGAAGGTGSGKGFHLMEEAARAQTPEQKQDLVNRVRAVHEDAGLRLADVGFGMPVMNAVAPTAGDFARYDRAGDMGAAPPTTTLERAAYDREKGAQALQRLYTLFLDPGKLDAHARGERQFGRNDQGAAGAVAVRHEDGSALNAAAAYQRGNGDATPSADAYSPAAQARGTRAADIQANSRSIARLQRQALTPGETQASRDEQIRIIHAENQRLQAGGNANPAEGRRESQAGPVAPADLLRGLRWVGTSQGQAVYELSDGRRVIAVKPPDPGASRAP